MDAARRGYDWTVALVVLIGVAIIGVQIPFAIDWYWYATAAVGTLGIAAIYVVWYRPQLPMGDSVPWWAMVLLALTVAVASWGLAPLVVLQVSGHVLVWATAKHFWHALAASAMISFAAGAGAALGTWGETEMHIVFWLMEVGAFAAAIGYGFWVRQARAYAKEQQRLLVELRAAQDRLTAASRQNGVLEERARVSRELHDTLTQSIAALVLVAGQAQRRGDPQTSIVRIEQMARHALTEARSVVAEFAPAAVHGDVARSLDAVAERFRRETHLAVEVDVAADVGGDQVAAETELALLRCTQEGLANVRRHAEATTATIVCRASADGLELTVADDGVGPRGEMSGGFGLAGMRDRIAALGGHVDLAAGAQGGAVLTVSIPHEVERVRA